MYGTIAIVAVIVVVSFVWLAEAQSVDMGWGFCRSKFLPQETSIFLWNVKLLPWPAVSDSQKRAEDILQKILQQNADIVVLTEVIDRDAASTICHGLRVGGYMWGTRPLQKWPRLNGGVLVASRIEPSTTDSIVYQKSTFKEADGFASKGAVRVMWPNLTLIATHLDACPGDVPTRITQIDEMQRLSLGQTNCIWAGDFNFDLRSDAETYGLVPLLHTAEPTYESKRLDGIIRIYGNTQIREKVLKTEGSDHLPILAHFTT